MDFGASLTQHQFAYAARSALRHSTCRHSGHSWLSNSLKPTPTFRRAVILQLRPELCRYSICVFADVASLLTCGTPFAATQCLSPDRSLTGADFYRFNTMLSLLLSPTNQTRAKPLFASKPSLTRHLLGDATQFLFQDCAVCPRQLVEGIVLSDIEMRPLP